MTLGVKLTLVACPRGANRRARSTAVNHPLGVKLADYGQFSKARIAE
jgi:hypothetical protein